VIVALALVVEFCGSFPLACKAGFSGKSLLLRPLINQHFTPVLFCFYYSCCFPAFTVVVWPHTYRHTLFLPLTCLFSTHFPSYFLLNFPPPTCALPFVSCCSSSFWQSLLLFSPQPPHFLLTHGKTKNLSNIFWIPYFSYFRMRLLKIFSVEVELLFPLFKNPPFWPFLTLFFPALHFALYGGWVVGGIALRFCVRYRCHEPKIVR